MDALLRLFSFFLFGLLLSNAFVQCLHSSDTELLLSHSCSNAVGPYCPSYSVAFKALFLIRTLGATYSNISDCDEVFNFWEPMHYLQYGTGLETWEYSPVYAIRSWAYILAHTIAAEITRLAMSANRVSTFFWIWQLRPLGCHASLSRSFSRTDDEALLFVVQRLGGTIGLGATRRVSRVMHGLSLVLNADIALILPFCISYRCFLSSGSSWGPCLPTARPRCTEQ